MKQGANIFGVTILVFWVGVILGQLFPLENNLNNATVLAIVGFVLAVILGILGDKHKLF